MIEIFECILYIGPILLHAYLIMEKSYELIKEIIHSLKQSLTGKIIGLFLGSNEKKAYEIAPHSDSNLSQCVVTPFQKTPRTLSPVQVPSHYLLPTLEKHKIEENQIKSRIITVEQKIQDMKFDFDKVKDNYSSAITQLVVSLQMLEKSLKEDRELLSIMHGGKIVRQYDGEHLLLPVLQNSASHINKFVLEQKSTVTRKRTVRRLRPFQCSSNYRKYDVPVKKEKLPPPGFSQKSFIPPRGLENLSISPLIESSQTPSLFNNVNSHYHPLSLSFPEQVRSSLPLQMPNLFQNYSNFPILNYTLSSPPHNLLPWVNSNELPCQLPSIMDTAAENNSGPITYETKNKPRYSVAELVSEDESITNLKVHTYRTISSESIRTVDFNKPHEGDSVDQESENEKSERVPEDEEADMLINDKMKENFKLILKEYPNGILSTKFAQVYKEKFDANLKPNDLGFHSFVELGLSCPDVIAVYPSKTARGSTDWIFFDINSKTVTEDSSKWIPRQVLENMQELSLMYSNGIPCKAVLKAYKEKFKVDLDVKKLGFGTLESFVKNCPSVMYIIEQDQGFVFPMDWGKFDQSELDDPENDMTGFQLGHVEFLWKNLFRSYDCDPLFKYKNFIIPAETTMKVIVSDILSPEIIWFQNADKLNELKELMDSMELFYEDSGNECSISESMTIPGLACAAQFSDIWHRVRIHLSLDEEIKIHYVDYGTTSYVKYKELRTLPRKFGELPIQAIKAKLYGIKPVSERGWSSEAVDYLFNICLNKTYFAEIIKVKVFEVPSLEVVLHNSDGSKDITINKTLVSLGFAEALVEEFKCSNEEAEENFNSCKKQGNYLDFSSYPRCFMRLLPFWINATGDCNDIAVIFDKAQKTLEKNEDIEKLARPPLCCAHHYFGQQFINNPELVCEAWEVTVRKWRNDLKNTFMHNLSQRLNKSLQLGSNKFLCSSNEGEENETDNLVKSNATNILHELMIDKEFISKKSIDLHDYDEFSQNFLTNNKGLGKDNKHFGTLSTPSSSFGGAPLKIESNENVKEVFITTRYVIDFEFYLLVFDDEIYMLRDELLKKLAPQFSAEILKMKLRLLQPHLSRCIPIGPKVNKYVHDELVKRNIIDQSVRATAIPLSIVGRLLSVILPDLAAYAHHFKEENNYLRRNPDFVLIWKDQENSAFLDKRKKFELSLENEGLKLIHILNADGENLNITEVRAPLEVLEKFSELLKIRMPVKKVKVNEWQQNKRRLSNINSTGNEEVPLLQKSIPTNLPEYGKVKKAIFNVMEKHLYPDKSMFPNHCQRFTAPYNRSYKSLFDPSECFTPAVRLRVIQYILDRSEFEERASLKNNFVSCDLSYFGIQNLLAEGIYIAAYPLHDDGEEDKHNRLIREWASLKEWYRFQPLDYIKDYFGVKIGLYFAWLGFYTNMLTSAALFGLFCFLYSFFTLPFDQPSQDICEEKLSVKMCPICDQFCDYWDLSDICFYSKINHFLINCSTVLFAVFISLWGVTFLKQWKRYSAEISHRWDLWGHDVEEEQVRPQYVAQLKCRRDRGSISKRCGIIETSFWSCRLPAVILSFSLAILLVTLALGAVIGVALYRVSVLAALTAYGRPTNSSYTIFITSFSAAIINLICMEILNKVYPRLMMYMTEHEMHRTQKAFNDSFILKMYLFNFVNYYSSIFYIAFIKGNFIGYPAHYNRIFGYMLEQCGPEGCLTELSIQMAVIMIGKQAFNTIMELILPLCTKLQKRKLLNKVESSEFAVPQWKKDYQLNQWDSQTLFLEYLEMVMQYGFVTLFASAFPLAPLFALINNIMETRLDAKKFLIFYQRPVSPRVRDIGVWFDILDSISKLAVVTNGFIIAFTSNFIPRMCYILGGEGQNLIGFLNSSLSVMDTLDLDLDHPPQTSVKYCRYMDYREPPWSSNKYEKTTNYWHILVARLVFVMIFENIVMLVVILYYWCIPDVPGWVHDQVKEESKVVKELINEELKKNRDRDNFKRTDYNEMGTSIEKKEKIPHSLDTHQHEAVIHTNYDPILPVVVAPDWEARRPLGRSYRHGQIRAHVVQSSG